MSDASRPYTLTTSRLSSSSTASTRNKPVRCRSATPSEWEETPRPSRARATSSRLGRPRLEPNVRWIAAAAITAMSRPPSTAVGVSRPSRTKLMAPKATSHRPTRRAGLVRWGDPAITTAAVTANRSAGNQTDGLVLRSDDPTGGHEPSTTPRYHHGDGHRRQRGQDQVPHQRPPPPHRGRHQHPDRHQGEAVDEELPQAVQPRRQAGHEAQQRPLEAGRRIGGHADQPETEGRHHQQQHVARPTGPGLVHPRGEEPGGPPPRGPGRRSGRGSGRGSAGGQVDGRGPGRRRHS